MAIRIRILLSLLVATIFQTYFANAVSMDILFLIDGSGSVKPHNFEKLKVFLQNIVDRLNVGPDGANVALIQFSSRELTKVEFNLDAHNSNGAVRSAINDVEYQEKYTYTGHAMKLARKQVFNGRGGDRPDARNFLLLFTDGEAADPHIARAQTKYLKSRGTHVMSIGFGPKTSVKRFQKELKVMATDKEKDVFLGGSDDLDKIVRRLLETPQPKADCSTSPCQNDGTCTNIQDGFSCSCTTDYEGNTCEKKRGPCARKPCMNDGVCKEVGDIFKCVCNEMFQGDICENKREVCRTQNADILFVMDGSASVSRAHYKIMTKFIIDLVERFNVSQSESHVALIQFSDQRRAIVEFFLDHYFTKDLLMRKINGISIQHGGSTYTGEALKEARKRVFIGARGDRTNVRNVLVLLTDGEAHDPDDAVREAGLLKDDNVSIITIGIGKVGMHISFDELLKKLASKPRYAFNAQFSELDTILDGVIKAACDNLRDT